MATKTISPLERLKNDEEVNTPFMCNDEDEFTKSLFIITVTIPNMLKMGKISEVEASAMYVDMFKMMAHDYLALAMSGKMPMYEFSGKDGEEYKDIRKIFEDSLSNLNVQLAMSGVPVHEGDNGKLVIDYEKMHKELGDE